LSSVMVAVRTVDAVKMMEMVEAVMEVAEADPEIGIGAVIVRRDIVVGVARIGRIGGTIGYRRVVGAGGQSERQGKDEQGGETGHLSISRTASMAPLLPPSSSRIALRPRC